MGTSARATTATAARVKARPVSKETDALLEHGALEVEGRLVVASNATFLCTISLDGVQEACVYKPIRGERPLWDFPHGTLAEREVATYLLAAATGFDLVPPTILRDGPFGRGMCQRWVEPAADAELVDIVPPDEIPPGWLRVLEAYDGAGAEVALVHADDPRLRVLATFDAVVNNADRKAGHVIVSEDGRVYGVDHGLCLHEEEKLRTVLWGWGGQPLAAASVELLDRLEAALNGPLAQRLAELIRPAEIRALHERIHRVRESGVHPEPGDRWPTVPWPVW